MLSHSLADVQVHSRNGRPRWRDWTDEGAKPTSDREKLAPRCRCQAENDWVAASPPSAQDFVGWRSTLFVAHGLRFD